MEGTDDKNAHLKYEGALAANFRVELIEVLLN